ncbi:LuxR C-terminal-related transcriptional regulator [Paenibacillus sp. 1-18]|uniref:LuxR C-terminal-related transcriptional regulator n=1 Tax=Paenibacillus sp. 1-18 TaxID=1333846 RepID=UPI00046F9395|nr:LuxR C-terminal-related transcriptional regulator [Paenibacillus sp. 1-18]
MGSFQLLSAKLKAPALRKQYVPRPELYRKLDRLSDHKVLVVQGSAGSGKTTLMTSYMSERPNLGWYWITLDEANNDARSFWYYVLEALKGLLGQEPEHLRTMFDALSQKPNLDHLLVLLVNRLEECRAVGTLVLDDFHFIDDTTLLQSLTFFLRFSPESIRIVLLTRETPRLYLGELAMSGKYLEVNERELAFTHEEAKLFLTQTLSLTLEPSTIHKLYQWAEGWVGGLQLSALAVVHHTHTLTEPVGILNRYMVDYLSNEILRSVSEWEQQFMLQTSVLAYFNEKICNWMLGINDAAVIITRLVEKHLFVITVDEEEGLYRYHQVFGDFLRAKLREQGEDTVRSLHLRAAEAYERMGSSEESLQHYLWAEAYKEAIRLLLATGHHFPNWTYLRQIPLDILSCSRPLMFQRLFYHFCNLEIEDMRQIINLTPQQEGDGLGSLFQLCRFMLGDEVFDLPVGMEWLGNWESLEMDAVTRAIILVTGGTMLSLKDQFATAMNWLNQAKRLEKLSPNPFLRFSILSSQAQVLETLGEFSACLSLYEIMFDLCENYPMLHPMKVINWIGLTGIQLKMMKLELAEESIATAKQIFFDDDSQLKSAYLYNEMELRVLHGDNTRAIELLEELKKFPLYQSPTYFTSILKYMLRYGLSNIEMENELLNRVEEPHSKAFIRLEDRLACARIRVARGEKELAYQHLDVLLPHARKHGIRTILVEGLLLKMTLIASASSVPGKELFQVLREAVHYGYENEYLSPFCLEMERLRPYFGLFLKDPDQELNSKEKCFAQLIQTLLEQSKMQVSLPVSPKEREKAILSERELEVLQVLAKGRSNKEIGVMLCISLATVKSHVINIYAKLQVSNRVEAVERGRELGLLY